MNAATPRTVAIKIDDDIKARIKRLADGRQLTSHWLMREAITQYVEREEKAGGISLRHTQGMGRVPRHRIACDRRRG